MNAQQLALRTKAIINKQIRQKGFEIDAYLLIPPNDAVNRDELSLLDVGQYQPTKESVKIVKVNLDEIMFAMEIGNNPNDLIQFISIEDETTTSAQKVEQAKKIIIGDSTYVIEKIFPHSIIDVLIVKDCLARRTK